MALVFAVFFIEDLSVVAHDSDAVFFEPPYGGGYEVDYPLKLLFAHPGPRHATSGPRLRSGGFWSSLKRLSSGSTRCTLLSSTSFMSIHRPGQLSLERSLVVDLLDKFRAAQLLLVENLEPHARSLGIPSDARESLVS